MTQTLTEGTTFNLIADLTGPYIGYPGYGHHLRVIRAGKNVVLQKVGKSSVWLRGVTDYRGTVKDRTKSIIVPKADLANYINLDTPTEPPVKTRRLGETPEGEDVIAANDPRIAWLWKDAGELAKKLGLCGQYDSFAAKLGLPGRDRDFKITKKVNGFSVRRTYSAQSQAEAEAKFDAELAAAGLKVSDEAVTV